MNTPKPEPISQHHFIGFPINSFIVEERRSALLHLDDEGMFDVYSPADTDHSHPVFVGRYASFATALEVANGLNRVWRAAPQKKAREVLAFVGRKS